MGVESATAHLIGVSTGALPCLNTLSESIWPARLWARLCLNVNALSRSILHRNVIVIGDIQSLSRDVVRLPYLERLAVGSQVGAEVEAVFGVGEAVGRDTNLGASRAVHPLLEGIERQVFGETNVAEEHNDKLVRHGPTPCFFLESLHANTLTVTESPIVHLQASFNAVLDPLDLSSTSWGRRGRGRRRAALDDVPCLQRRVSASCVGIEACLREDTVASLG